MARLLIIETPHIADLSSSAPFGLTFSPSDSTVENLGHHFFSFFSPWLKEKILTTEQSVEGMKVELINLQPKLIAKILSLFLPHVCSHVNGKC